MTEPFKNIFNKDLITQIAKHIKNNYNDFDTDNFIADSSDGIEKLEMKARSKQIADKLAVYLPNDFVHSAKVIKASLAPYDSSGYEIHEDGIRGWAIMPISHYIGKYGLDNFDISMQLFKEITSRFTAEFDIRFFLIRYQKQALETLKEWVNDPDYHVRRLVSEGTRPLLPWGIKINSFVEDPTPIIPLLEALKDDSEEYVRRSVANNLNDISKQHPDIVINIAKEWIKNADKNRKKLIRHALRTLIKKGNKKALEVLGYKHAEITINHFRLDKNSLNLGDDLNIELELYSNTDCSQNIIIDYAIHHVKANGTTSPKIFKWKDIKLDANSVIKISKKHSMKKVTTRVYYSGIHKIEVFINGISYCIKEFNFKGLIKNHLLLLLSLL